MKKIIACIALTLLFILSAAASFFVNDLSAYRHWMLDNRPKIMENFGHSTKDRKGPLPQAPKGDPHFKDNDHHPMKKSASLEGAPERNTTPPTTSNNT